MGKEMRYTKKSAKFVNAYEWNKDLPTKTFVQLGMNKLGEHEDIEDELGIDLITLFKVFTHRHIYIREKASPQLEAVYGTGTYFYPKVNTNFLVINIKEKALQLYGEDGKLDEVYYFQDYGYKWGFELEEIQCENTH